mmetsp:Transcript_10417/g.39407  ORF Transcript_10417/g.39407 Transcript_10417/m.39407 type:complete len:635 (-) Transcript_10417:131-2035(-)
MERSRWPCRRRQLLLCLVFVIVCSSSLGSTGESVPKRSWAQMMEKRRRAFDGELQRHTAEMKARLDQLFQVLKDFRRKKEDAELTPPDGNFSAIYRPSDLSNTSRSVTIVTTAALPWMTGTAVNPLLRAAHLARGRAPGKVTLYLPWLELEQQRIVFPNNITFDAPFQQEVYIRKWLDRANLGEEQRGMNIRFYRATHVKSFGSVFPTQDIVSLIPNEDADICILEEPEHLNWYKMTGLSWKEKFRYVVGIMHTNYLSYVLHEPGPGSVIKEFVLSQINRWMCRAYCDRVIKLSGTLQKYVPSKEVVCNVHGVREDFLKIGDQVAKDLRRRRSAAAEPDGEVPMYTGKYDSYPATCMNVKSGPLPFGAYFIGKSVWAKGHDTLIRISLLAREDKVSRLRAWFPTLSPHSLAPPSPPWAQFITRTRGFPKPEEDRSAKEPRSGFPKGFYIDVYGSGPEHNEIVEKAMYLDAPLSFHGAVDHAQLHRHKVLVNPSVSEVLATTTAEALAMNKFVVCARHPSNAFFYSLGRNCLTYTSDAELLSTLAWALEHDPEPLTPEQRHMLTWEAATNRLIDASKVTYREYLNSQSDLDQTLHALHQSIGASPAAAFIFGAMLLDFQRLNGVDSHSHWIPSES